MNALKITHVLTSSLRRYFVCLFVLLGFFACTISAFAYPRTDDDLIETTCGEQGSKYVLIAYDTIHGSTAEVAEYLGNELCDQGFRVDVLLAANADDISAYDAVIVGSALYGFSWLADAKQFLRDNQATLSQLPTAYFVVGASMYEDTPANREAVKRAFVDPVINQYPNITPLSVGTFGGAVNFDENKYNFIEKIVLRIVGLILGYRNNADWRSWQAIENWGEDLAGILQAERK
jgi:menaquinone-dependent protoporphyrinogen oxidase